MKRLAIHSFLMIQVIAVSERLWLSLLKNLFVHSLQTCSCKGKLWLFTVSFLGILLMNRIESDRR